MDLRGKTVVVTGGTSGIGRATALAFARRGADVTAIGRDATKGAALLAEMTAASGGLGRFVQADLSLVGEARRVVAEVAGRVRQLDALILSAGVIEFEAATTAEGLDRLFAINFLHKLVIVDGLAPLLAHGRVVLVAADLPRLLRLDWRNFEGPRVYAGLRGVGQLHYAALVLVQHLAATGLHITAIHPGRIDTGIYRSFARWPWSMLASIMRALRTPIARPVALLDYLAFSPEAAGLAGEFFPSVKRFDKHRALAHDAATVARVVAVARAAIGSVPERATAASM